MTSHEGPAVNECDTPPAGRDPTALTSAAQRPPERRDTALATSRCGSRAIATADCDADDDKEQEGADRHDAQQSPRAVWRVKREGQAGHDHGEQSE
jgi:hypothetical protein